MVRRSRFMETSRRKKSSKKRPWRKWLWKNDSSKSHLGFRSEQHYSSANELVGGKRKRDDSDFKSGVSPLIRDNLRLQKPNYYNNLSGFDRLGWRRRSHCAKGILSGSGFKHGVSPLKRERWSEPNFQKRQRFNGRVKYRKGDNYRRVKHSKGNMFVNMGRALHKTNEVFESGVSPLIKDRLGLLDPNRFNKLSVFDRLGSDKRSYFAKGKKQKAARRGDPKSGVSPFFRDRLKWPKPGFQKKQPLHWKTKSRKGGRYRKGKYFNGNIFVKIDNNQNEYEIDVLDDVYEVDDNQFQPQIDVPAICDDINSEEASSNECEEDNFNHFQSRTVVRSICDDGSNECKIDNCKQFQPRAVVRSICDDISNERKIDNCKQFQPRTDVHDMCDNFSTEEASSNECEMDNDSQFQPQTDASSNECVSDNLHAEAVPDFVSDISPAGSFKFVDGVRSFESERFCVELYPMDKLGSS